LKDVFIVEHVASYTLFAYNDQNYLPVLKISAVHPTGWFVGPSLLQITTISYCI